MLNLPRHQDGFTLVEALVALALLALISVYGLTALSFSRSYDRIGRKIETSINEELAFERIREVMSQFQFLVQEEDKPPYFIGKQSELLFLALSNGKAIAGGPFQVRFFENELGQLVMQWKHFPVLKENKPTDEVIVLNDIADLQFSYGATPEVVDFTHSWTSRDTYPHVVKISLRKKSSDGLPAGMKLDRMFTFGANK